MYPRDLSVTQAETIFIAVGDGVLADSMRFSLELEGFETRYCDEHTLLPALKAPCVCGACLVLDQDVFARVVEAEGSVRFAEREMPVILMVSQATEGVRAKAAAAGVTEIVEKPLLGGVLSETIHQVLGR